MLVKLVSALRRSLPPLSAETLIKSFKCWGRKPSQPPAIGTGMLEASGGIGILVSGCGDGCLDFKAAMVSLLRSAIKSSEQARRTAPLKSPSSSLVTTLVASASRFWERGFERGRIGVTTGSASIFTNSLT